MAKTERALIGICTFPDYLLGGEFLRKIASVCNEIIGVWSAFLSLDSARAGLPWPPCLRGPFSDLLLACSFPQARSLTGAHASPSIPLSKPCSAVRTLEFPALMALNQLQELTGPLL